MKKLVRWLFKSDLSYCKFFHSALGVGNKWYCQKCNLLYDRKLSDNDTGPR